MTGSYGSRKKLTLKSTPDGMAAIKSLTFKEDNGNVTINTLCENSSTAMPWAKPQIVG